MKKLVGILISAVMIFCFFGCNEAVTGEVDFFMVEKDILSAVSYADLKELTKDHLSDFFDINPEYVENMLVKISQDSTMADELIMIKAVDTERAAQIHELLETHLKSQKNSFRDYNPTEYEKLSDVSVNIKDTYVYFSVSNAKSVTDKVFEKYF